MKDKNKLHRKKWLGKQLLGILLLSCAVGVSGCANKVKPDTQASESIAEKAGSD